MTDQDQATTQEPQPTVERRETATDQEQVRQTVDEKTRKRREVPVELENGKNVVVGPLRVEAYDRIRDQFFALISGRFVKAIQHLFTDKILIAELSAMSEGSSQKKGSQVLGESMGTILAAINDMLPSLGDEIPSFIAQVGTALVDGMVTEGTQINLHEATALDMLTVRQACLEHSRIAELLAMEGNFLTRLGRETLTMWGGGSNSSDQDG